MGVFFLFCAALPINISANQSIDKISMLTLELLPYGYNTPDGGKAGMLYDIMNGIMADSGVGIANKIKPAKRLINDFSKDNNVCAILMDSPLSRVLSTPVAEIGYKMSVGVIPKAGIELGKYSDLYKLKIAVPRWVVISKQFDTDKMLSKEITPKYLNALSMLKHGRVDAVAGVVPSLLYVARREGISREELGVPMLLVENDFILFCSAAIPMSIKEKLAASVTKLRNNGEIENVIANYLGTN